MSQHVGTFVFARHSNTETQRCGLLVVLGGGTRVLLYKMQYSVHTLARIMATSLLPSDLFNNTIVE